MQFLRSLKQLILAMTCSVMQTFYRDVIILHIHYIHSYPHLPITPNTFQFEWFVLVENSRNFNSCWMIESIWVQVIVLIKTLVPSCCLDKQNSFLSKQLFLIKIPFWISMACLQLHKTVFGWQGILIYWNLLYLYTCLHRDLNQAPHSSKTCSLITRLTQVPQKS